MTLNCVQIIIFFLENQSYALIENGFLLEKLFINVTKNAFFTQRTLNKINLDKTLLYPAILCNKVHLKSK